MQPPVAGGGGVGPILLGRAELLAYPDDRGQVQYFPFPGMKVRLAGAGQCGVDVVPVRPHRADDHHEARGAQQRPHQAAG